MPQDFPEQTYYPSAKVRLTVRFEEYQDQEKEVRALAPKVPVTLAKGNSDSRADLVVKEDPSAPPGVVRYMLVPSQGSPSGGKPQQQDKSSDDLTQIVGGIIPKKANLGLNGARQADTLSLTIRYMDCPVDPRAIRSAGVEFYLGTVPQEDYIRGIQGETRSVSIKTKDSIDVYQEPVNLIPDSWTDAQQDPRTNLRFQGFVDKWRVVIDGETEPMIELECRDNTVLLIDQQQPAKGGVSEKDPIDKAIANYLAANFPQMAGLSVEYRPAGLNIPVLGTVLAKTAYRPKLGPVAQGGHAEKTSVWDYLTDICGSIGHNIRLEGTVIVIQPVKTLYSNAFSGRPDDPFTERVVGGQRVYTRHFILGRNVSSLNVDRSYSKSVPTNVEVRCYSGKQKTTLVERFPLKGDQVAHPVPGDRAEQKWLVWRVEGIEDKKTLRLLAQSVFETVGRNELSVSLKTKNLASFGAGNTDPDILDMKAGDAITLLVQRDGDDSFSGMTTLEAFLLVQEKAQTFLIKQGFAKSFANAYAKAYIHKAFQTTFRLRGLGIQWDIDSGVVIDMQAVNYIEVRADKLLPSGEEIKPDGSSKGQNQGKV